MTTTIALAIVAAVLLVAFGYWLGAQTAVSPAAAPDTAVDHTAVSTPAWFSKVEAIDQLRALRNEMEEGGMFSADQVLRLFDVCAYLGFDEGEAQAVVGAGLAFYIDESADLDDWELETDS